MQVNSKTAVYLLSAVLIGIVFHAAEAASSSKQARDATIGAAASSATSSTSHHQSASASGTSSDSSARSGWGGGPITYAHGLAAVIHPLVLLPLVYFGILWLIVLYGVAAFKHVPQESHGHGQGWRSSSGHGRYTRSADGGDQDWFTNIQKRVLAAL